MSESFEFCQQRANDAAAEAKASDLENVRERALRAEKTWRGLAAQAKRVLVERKKAEIVRTERRAAEAAALALAET